MKKLLPKKLLPSLLISIACTASAFAQDGIFAQVNDEVILRSELNQMIDDLAQAKNTTPNQALAQEALDMLILRKLQLGIINRAGITANSQAIDAQLLKIAKDQGFNTLSDFQKSLDAQKSGSYAAFRQALIDDALISALWQNQLSSRVKINQSQINAFLASPEGAAINSDKYRTLHVRVPYVDKFANLSAAQKQEAMAVANRLKRALQSGQEINAAMNDARGDYLKDLQVADTGYNVLANLPKELANVITRLPIGGVSDPIITENGIDVIHLVDKSKGGAVMIDEYNTSHILIKVDGTQDEQTAAQKINNIYNALQQGSDFEMLAAAHSDDLGTASQNGNLGWVSEGQMVQNFEIVMKNTPKGSFSTPFATEFGYHIIKVNDTRSRDVTQEYKQATARQIILNQLAPTAYEDWLAELKSEAYIKLF